MPQIHSYEFRTLLQAQRRHLLEELDIKIAGSGEDPGIASRSKELQDIEVALARIADGSYGACIDCGAEIGRTRLKADPTLERCPPCQSLVNGKK